MEKRYLTLEELSRYLAVPKQTIYQWTSQKRIPFTKVGRLRFDKKKIESWLKERSIEPENFVKKA